MAQNSVQSHGGAHAASAQGHAEAHHPTWKTYVVIGAILTFITAVEVSAYYTPAWETSRIYVPSMIFLSSIKFALVVLFYMHLKYDHKVFRALFTGPFAIAFVTILGLLFLFGQLAIRFGGAAAA
ncbi:MAG TPA: cytochrome C oxidase subunit IV family protein [Gemmatimonadaceae bacterium]|nr:cytochrome C oxidase subunit IV family protein [Gemmatimonadaceae bacterium]